MTTSTPVTSADVARAAGVSRATVSNILNGHHARFPAATRQKVLGAAAELGYRPSRAGRSLATGRSYLVMVLLPDLTFSAQLQDHLDRIVEHTSRSGMTAVIRFGGRDGAESVRAAMDLDVEAVVDFGVLDPSQRAELVAAGCRVVPRRAADRSHDPIGTEAARLQVEESQRRGPRTLVYANLSDRRSDPLSPARLAAVRAEAARLGLDEPITVSIPLSRAGARDALAGALETLPGSTPIAVCCYDDDVAMAVLAGARALGLDVPGRMSVIGIDHTPVGQLVDPPLTTVAIDNDRYIDAVLDELESGDSPEPTMPESAISSLVVLVRGGTS